MWQRGDYQRIDLLSSVRTGEVQPGNINIHKSRVIKPGAEDYPHITLCFLAQNADIKRHHVGLKSRTPLLWKTAGNLPQGIAQDKIDKVLKNQSQPGGLQEPFTLKWLQELC